MDIAYLFRLDGVNRDEVRRYSMPVSSTNGMSSPRGADAGAIDLRRDVPTTAEDVEVLGRLRRETPTWFSLSPAEFEALVPQGALDRHPVMRPEARVYAALTLPQATPLDSSRTLSMRVTRLHPAFAKAAAGQPGLRGIVRACPLIRSGCVHAARAGNSSAERKHPMTSAVIAAIPPERAGYRPHPDSRSAFDLAWHIVSAEIKYLDAIAAGVFPHDLRPIPDDIRKSSDIT